MAVSLGTIFVLNAIAAGVPSARSSGSRSRSSVSGRHRDPRYELGRGAACLRRALGIATTVNRPRVVDSAARRGDRRRAEGEAKLWPGRRLFASRRRATTPEGALYAWLVRLARIGLTLTLYLIGTGISRRTLRQSRPAVAPPGACSGSRCRRLALAHPRGSTVTSGFGGSRRSFRGTGSGDRRAGGFRPRRPRSMSSFPSPRPSPRKR